MVGTNIPPDRIQEWEARQPNGDLTTDSDRLVVDHLGLARSLAARFANRGERYEDLAQVAAVGLVKAAQRFDVDRQVRFSTFATATITGELKRHFRDARWGLHVRRALQERYMLVRDTLEYLGQKLQRAPTVEEIAEYSGLPVGEVERSMGVRRAMEVDSLDQLRAQGTRVPGGNDATDAVDTSAAVDAALRRLRPLERQVVRMRFVDEMSQSAIAAELGVSQMQISRVLARALGRMRMWLEPR